MNPERQMAAEAAPPKRDAGLIARAYGGLNRFVDEMQELEEVIEDLGQLGGDTIEPTLRKLRRQIRDFEPSVTMIGQVKAGKTSLVNAMVGRPDFLPADINPWTSVVTSLHMSPAASQAAQKARFSFFSEEEWSHLLSRGGRMGELAARAGADKELEKVRRQLEEMREKSRQRLGRKFEMLLGQEHEYGYADEELVKRYVCLGDDVDPEDGVDAADAKQGRFADITKSADLYLGQPELPTKFCIRDTPGVNDTFMIREQITVNAIRQSRLCVVVLSAHQALSTVDLALIRLISNIRSREVIIFVNRIDELQDPSKEIPEIRASIQATLKAHDGPTDAQVIFGSAFWASRAIRGEYRTLGKASAKALLNLAQSQIAAGLKEAKVEEMVWTLSGLPALCAAISDRVRTGEGAEFQDRVVRTAQNVANGLTQSVAAATGRATGGPQKEVAPEVIDREMEAIETRAGAMVTERFASLTDALDNRLTSSRRTFLSRATASLIKHLETYGENEVWTYDPAGLRVLLRSGYQLFAAKASKAGEQIMTDISYEIRTLYNGAFEPLEDTYEVAPPQVPRAPSPVMLGQTIALDIKGNWWTRWWRRRRSYEAFADEFSGLIDAEIAPIVSALTSDHAVPYRDAISSTLREFIDVQRKSLRALAEETQDGIDALRERYAEDATERSETLHAALETLARFRRSDDDENGE
ncbi:MAG: dynamin family protein [Pseudomonadota bacterium]